MIRKKLAIVLVIICALLFLPQPVSAKEEVILAPAFTDLGNIDSTEVHQLKVTLFNQTSQKQSFAVHTVVLVLDLETNQLDFAPNNAPDISYLGTLDVPAKIEVEAGQSYELNTLFKLSPLIAPGSHQFAFIFQPEVSGGKDTNLILGEMAAIVNFTSGGNLNYKADMNLNPVPNPSIVDTPELNVDISNRGNAIIQPLGVINLRAVFGIPQNFSQPFNTQAQLLFQGQTRGFDIALEFGDRAVLGLYEAEAVVTYGPQHKVIARKTSLFILPWYFLVGFIVILAGGGLVYYRRKTLRNHESHNPAR